MEWGEFFTLATLYSFSLSLADFLHTLTGILDNFLSRSSLSGERRVGGLPRFRGISEVVGADLVFGDCL